MAVVTTPSEGRRAGAAAFLPAIGWAAMLALVAMTLLLALVDPTPDDPSSPNIVYVPLLLGMVVSFGTVGALLADRRSQNPIGWMLLLGSILLSLSFLATEYHNNAVYERVPALPSLVYLVLELLFAAGLVLGGLVVLVFPSGSLPRYGKAILALVVCGVTLMTVATALAPGDLPDGRGPNPLGIEGSETILDVLNGLGNVCIVLGFVAATVSLVLRLRAAHGDERKQLEWFAFVATILAGCLVVAAFQAGPISDIAWLGAFISFTALPIAIAVAILKYRLYDIDTLVSRTLVYVPLVGILGGLYAAAVALLQRLSVAVLGESSDAAVVLATLVIVGAFTPIRRSLETAVDRRFKPVPTVVAEPLPSSELIAFLDDPLVVARMQEIARRVASERWQTPARLDPTPPQLDPTPALLDPTDPPP